MARPLKTEVNLEAIQRNYLLAKRACPNAKAFAVVKANAYGHGAVAVARYLDSTVDAFAVASIEEALSLRAKDVHSPIMLLEGVFEANEWDICLREGFWSAVENRVQLQSFLESDVEIEKLFVKIDTGMHRLGVKPEDASEYVRQLKLSGRVKEVLLMTHFACADELSSSATSEQLDCFSTVTAELSDLNISVANSAAILKQDIPDQGWIRPGIMLYGISPFAEISASELGLQPAMTFKSKVISVRHLNKGDRVGYAYSFEAQGPCKIATIAVGYGDGYPRHATNGAPVMVNGVLCPLAGRVSMDMITVDVTHLAEVSIGDEVILWGESNPVEQVAQAAGTIGYELVTRMTSRSPIQYQPAND